MILWAPFIRINVNYGALGGLSGPYVILKRLRRHPLSIRQLLQARSRRQILRQNYSDNPIAIDNDFLSARFFCRAQCTSDIGLRDSSWTPRHTLIPLLLTRQQKRTYSRRHAEPLTS